MQKFNCKTCGAELYWDAEAGALKCQYCDSVFNPSEFEDETLKENNHTDESVDSTYTNSQDIIEGMVVYKCTHCGAEVVTSETTMATTCVYCGRAISLTDKTAGEFRPEIVLPFKITKETAIKNYKEHISKFKFKPKLFCEEQTIKKIQGLYVPFYLHSAILDSNSIINAENVKSTRSGDDKIEHHSVYTVDISIEGKYKNLPTDASKKLEDKLMDSLEPFSLNKLTDFNPAYMAGYFAEQPDESKNELADRAHKRMESAMKEKILDTAGTYTTKNIATYNGEFLNSSSKYAMLPIWLLNVDYNGKMYTFAVNGDTGKTVGAVPKSKIKIACTSLITFLLSQGICMLFNFLAM